MRDEEEVQEKADEMADRIDDSDGSDNEASTIRRILEWVLELNDDL